MKKTLRALILSVGVVPASFAFAGYQLQELGNADVNLYYATYPFGGINDSGQTSAFALFFGNFSESTAYRWSGSAWEALGALPTGAFTSYSYGFDINNSGIVAGSDFTGPAAARRWTSLSVFDTLQPLTGKTNSEGLGINNNGDVVGFSKSTNSDITPTFWAAGGTVGTSLGTPAGFATAKAFDINNAGWVAGEGTNSGLTSALRYENGTWRTLELPVGFDESEVHRISETGFVAGVALASGGAHRGILWDDQGKAVNLGVLSGDTYSIAWGTNSFGWVVGESGNPASQVQRAFVYRPGVGMQDLNALVGNFTFMIGYGINEKGDVVALGLNSNNEFSVAIAKRTDIDLVPQAYQYLRGLANGGNTLQQLHYPDNSRQSAKRGFVVNPSEAPIQLVATTSSPDLSPTALTVQLKAQADTPNLRESIELLNVQTGQYEVVGTPANATFNTDRTTLANAGGNLSRFVVQGGANAGQVKVKVSYFQVGPTTKVDWAAKVDQLIVTVEP